LIGLAGAARVAHGRRQRAAVLAECSLEPRSVSTIFGVRAMHRQISRSRVWFLLDVSFKLTYLCADAYLWFKQISVRS
jgi:hypothetical protein